MELLGGSNDLMPGKLSRGAGHVVHAQSLVTIKTQASLPKGKRPFNIGSSIQHCPLLFPSYWI